MTHRIGTIDELDELVAAWRASEAAGDHLQTIVTAERVGILAFDRRSGAVRDALAAGHTWDDIALAVGMEREQAYVEYAPIGASRLSGWNG